MDKNQIVKDYHAKKEVNTEKGKAVLQFDYKNNCLTVKKSFKPNGENENTELNEIKDFGFLNEWELNALFAYEWHKVTSQLAA